MPICESTFVKDMLLFTKRSLNWCAKESEKETMRISEALDHIYADLKKRSALSKESMEAFEEFLEEHSRTGKNKEIKELSDHPLENLMKDLSKLRDQERELSQFINPVVKNLQFQDSLRQNLGNLLQMLEIWNENRDHLLQKSELTYKDLHELGEKFLECMTSQDEREIVRSQIKGLSGEIKRTGAIEF